LIKIVDKAITELDELATTPEDTDIVPIVDDPGGSPITKKITVANLTKEQSLIITEIASSATPTPARASRKTMLILTALTEEATFGVPTGTPVNGDLLFISVTDDGTARALTWNAIYRAGNIALPTTTILGKTMYIGFIYNDTASKWDLIAYDDNH